MDLYLLISIIAILISSYVAFQNYLKPFKLFVKIEKNIFWIGKDNTISIDLLIIFSNLGIRLGYIESILLECKQSKSSYIMKPDVFYRVNPDRKIEVEEFWHSFVLEGKKTHSKLIGFKSNIDPSEVKNGDFNITMKIFYKKNPFKNRQYLLELKQTLDYNFDRAYACGHLDGQSPIPLSK